jgi:hypothetical protein
LEDRVLNGLKDHLMHPDLVKAFIDEFHREANRLAATQDATRDRIQRELESTQRDMDKIIDAIKAGVPGEAVKDEMGRLEARRIDLTSELERAPAPMPRLHPNLAEVYRAKVSNLAEALNEEHTRSEASALIRNLIQEIRLVPDDGELKIELFGELAALINLANENPRPQGTGVQITLVAGARNRFGRLCGAWLLPSRSQVR